MPMFIQNRQGRSLVLGLQWPEKQALQDRDDAVESFATAHNVDTTQVRFVVCESQDGKVRLFGMADPDGPDLAAKSLALSMLCLAHGDGIYAAVARDDAFSVDSSDPAAIKVWICSINDGIVSREAIVSRDEATQHVNEMSMIRQRTVYATAGCGIRDAQALDLDAMISGLPPAAIEAARFRKMASDANRKAGKYLFIPIAIVVVLAGVLLYRHHKAEVAREQVIKARAAARLTYLRMAPTKIGILPLSGQWMPDAVGASYQAFPLRLDGFTLKAIQCSPAECKAAYFTDKDESFSQALFRSYFKSMPVLPHTSGKAIVSFVSGNASGAIVSLPMKFKTRQVNVELLSNPPSHVHGVQDWIGLEMHAFLPGKVKSQSVINLGQMGGTLAGMSPLYVSKVTIDGNDAMPVSRAAYIAATGSVDGFVPVMVEWSPGVGPSASFRVKFIQLSRLASS